MWESRKKPTWRFFKLGVSKSPHVRGGWGESSVFELTNQDPYLFPIEDRRRKGARNKIALWDRKENMYVVGGVKGRGGRCPKFKRLLEMIERRNAKNGSASKMNLVI